MCTQLQVTYNKIVFSYWYFAAKQKSIYDYRCSGWQDRTAGTKPRDTHRSRQDQEDLLGRLVTRVNSQTALLMLAQDNRPFLPHDSANYSRYIQCFVQDFNQGCEQEPGDLFPCLPSHHLSLPLLPSLPFPSLISLLTISPRSGPLKSN